MFYKINKSNCTGCSYCKLNCKFNSIIPDISSNIMSIEVDICTNCGVCINVCPNNAISSIMVSKNEKEI